MLTKLADGDVQLVSGFVLNSYQLNPVDNSRLTTTILSGQMNISNLMQSTL